MKRIIALAVVVTLAVAQFPSVNAQLQQVGVITGTVGCPEGPLAGATVQAIDAAGTIAGTAVTMADGAFTIDGLRPGTYTVQVHGSNGLIIGAASATLTSETMTAMVKIDSCAGVLAALATAAGTGGGIGARTILAGVAAAAAALGTLAAISTEPDVSGSR